MSKLFDQTKDQHKKMPDFRPIQQLERKGKYILSPQLEQAVNVAMLLGQPLLLTGEPGTGKTQLAHYLAQHYDSDGGNIFIFNTKTSSRASDLFYRYDSLRHFQYIQNKSNESLSDAAVEQRFIHYQALGAAIHSGRRAVVLIDEIDKAPRDLPNDVLDVLESLSFEVPEINKVGKNRISSKPENRPVVIITSNSEKNLPDAFLRRCVFYHIPFPSDEMLQEILAAKTTKFQKNQQIALIKHFNQIRQNARRKPPATAELVAWAFVLENGGFDPLKLDDMERLNDEEKELLEASYGLLLKNKEDLQAKTKG